jgi:RNA polymerase sigma factor (sigma-70 family)
MGGEEAPERASRGGGGAPLRRRRSAVSERRLSLAEAQFYARVYDPARKGSLAELRRRGCDEQEAEEFFAAAYAKVMESVDPLARDFSAPQMVSFVKVACSRRLSEERRQRAQREGHGARTPDSYESHGESPPELAEEREVVAVGREALAMLSERDRLVFTSRHLRGLTPEEILAEIPGLSMRTYRKIIQRANARAFDAFERIEVGRRCAEMEDGLLRRYAAGEGPEPARGAIEAQLAPCRPCRQARARMRDHLFDVASGALLVASLGPARPRAAVLPAQLLELASGGAHVLEAAGRVARERLREVLLRLAGWLPGPGGADPAVSQALGASWWRVASVCTGGIAAGACAAAGVMPGLGAADSSVHDRHQSAFPAKQSKASVRRVADPGEYAAPVRAASSSEPEDSRTHTGAKRATRAAKQVKAGSASREGASVSVPATGEQVATEFGPESTQPTPPASPSPESSSHGHPVSAAVAASGGTGSSAGSPGANTGSSSEFGQ